MIFEKNLHDKARNEANGFTILEVLIALTIFAIVIGALSSLFQTSLRHASVANDLRRATQLAESQLSRFGKDFPLEQGTYEGISPNGLRWEAEISLADPIDHDMGIALYRIQIEAGLVSNSSTSVKLSTLRIGVL